jgi:hypothetical protein
MVSDLAQSHTSIFSALSTEWFFGSVSLTRDTPSVAGIEPSFLNRFRVALFVMLAFMLRTA